MMLNNGIIAIRMALITICKPEYEKLGMVKGLDGIQQTEKLETEAGNSGVKRRCVENWQKSHEKEQIKLYKGY